MLDLTGKRVLVCGAAASGIAAAKLARDNGAAVTVADLKPIEKLEKQADALLAMGAELCFGRNPDEILESFDLCVISPGIPFDLPFLDRFRALGRQVIGETEFASWYCNAPICAITGTNGKTTTTSMAYDIFKTVYQNAALVGNIGIPLAEKAQELDANDYAVLEVSSFQLETISTFRAHIAAVLNITPDHLNRHKTMENYVATKERIFENQSHTDFLVLNYDDPYARDMAKRAKSRVIFFSSRMHAPGGVYIEGNHFVSEIDGEKQVIMPLSDLRVPGRHNVENALAAMAMGICAGIPIEKIAQALSMFKAVPHRIEFVRELNGVTYFNDSKATNTDSAIKALEAIGERILLIGGGKDKGCDFSDWVKLFHGKVKKLVLIGETSDQIAECCDAHGFSDYERANSLKSAIEICRAAAAVGDVVLLSPACASFDMFDSYEQRGDLFRQFVNEL